MACPITFINQFINDYKLNNEEINIENFKKKLFSEHSIMSKYCEQENLLIVYHKYDLPTKTQLEKECRSLVIDASTLNIISYTCPNTISNKEAQKFLLNNSNLKLDTYKCYEGTILSLYNHNDKWYLSTRRCIDSKDSKWNQTNYYNMFIEVLDKENITKHYVDKCRQIYSPK
jgi:hypothetical protein